MTQISEHVYRFFIEEPIEGFGLMHAGGTNIYFVAPNCKFGDPWSDPDLLLARAQPGRGSARAWVRFGRIWRSLGKPLGSFWSV